MDNGSILYIPIQINGGQNLPNNLLDRELFIKNGELYVGNGTSEPDMIIGKVVKGAVIEDPKLLGTITLGNGVILNKDMTNKESEGKLYLVDDGNFPLDNPDDYDTLTNIMSGIIARVENLENSGTGGGSVTSNTILPAELG